MHYKEKRKEFNNKLAGSDASRRACELRLQRAGMLPLNRNAFITPAS
jgi:hypothetical protein